MGFYIVGDEIMARDEESKKRNTMNLFFFFSQVPNTFDTCIFLFRESVVKA